ncbi:MAG: beta-propeller fold lactonase family protein [Phycisphaerales bacterium JB061]
MNASARALFISAGFAIACSATAQNVPDELSHIVAVDSSDAIVRVIGELDSPDGDPATIEVIAPAWATIQLNPSEGTGPDIGAVPFDPPSLLEIGEDPEADMGADITYSPDGSEILILSRSSQNITVFDAATQTVTDTIPLSSLPFAMDVTPDGTRAVVANYADDTATIVDLATGAETVVNVGDGPGTVSISPDGSLAAIGCGVDSNFHVIDLNTNTVVRTIATPGFTQTLSFGTEAAVVDFRYTTPLVFVDSSTIAFPGRFDDVLAFIDIATGARTDLALADTDPAGIDISGDGSTILVGHAINPGVVTVIDGVTRTVDRSIVGPARCNGPVALNADGSAAVIAFQNAARHLDLNTDSFSAALNTSNLNDVIANASRTRAVGVGFSGAIIDFATGAVLARANDFVSASFGAVSPTGDQAAMVSTTFGDDLVVVESDATPSLLYYGRTGPDPEGDISRHTAVSADGTRAVSSNVFSDNLTIFNAATGAKLASAPLDERPGEVAITPDGSKAVVVNLDGYTVSIVDMATGTTTAVPSARRIAQVEISPDSNYAYLAQIASGDGIRKLDLNTATFVGGLTSTGNLGGVGYSYSQNSQISLSPDGAYLAIASSFTDELIILDTASMTVSQSTPAGTFPTRVAWNPEGTRIIVSDRDGDRVYVYDFAGGTASLAGQIPTGDSPFDVVAMPGSDRAFVLNWGDSNVGVLDLASLSQTSTIALPYRPMGASLSSDASELRVGGGNGSTTAGNGTFSETREGEMTVIDTTSLAVVDQVDIGQPVANAGASADGSVIAFASPSADGIVVAKEAVDCLADTNGDGMVSPADFSAWVAQFNSNGPLCDQNNDGMCSPADFSAWVANYNAGCP